MKYGTLFIVLLICGLVALTALACGVEEGPEAAFQSPSTRGIDDRVSALETRAPTPTPTNTPRPTVRPTRTPTPTPTVAIYNVAPWSRFINDDFTNKLPPSNIEDGLISSALVTYAKNATGCNRDADVGFSGFALLRSWPIDVQGKQYEGREYRIVIDWTPQSYCNPTTLSHELFIDSLNINPPWPTLLVDHTVFEKASNFGDTRGSYVITRLFFTLYIPPKS